MHVTVAPPALVVKLHFSGQRGVDMVRGILQDSECSRRRVLLDTSSCDQDFAALCKFALDADEKGSEGDSHTAFFLLGWIVRALDAFLPSWERCSTTLHIYAGIQITFVAA
jgi:hypothetical protein